MKEEDYRSDASATSDVHETIIAEDGSYRIVHPESGSRSYTDAHFRTAEDASDVPPRYYEPEAPRRRTASGADADGAAGTDGSASRGGGKRSGGARRGRAGCLTGQCFADTII